MNKLKITLLTLLLLIILPITVKADCQSDFKAIEDKFKVTYEYNKDTDDFTITIVNPNYEKYEYGFNQDHLDKYKYSGYRIDSTITKKVNGYKEEKYFYLIVGVDPACKGIVYKQEEKKLYKYNKYADNPLCEGNEDFALCQKEYDKEIDEETFKSRLETYKKTKETHKDDDSNEEKENTKQKNQFKELIKKIIEYIKKEKIKIMTILIFVIILVITIALTIKSSIKSRRLE